MLPRVLHDCAKRDLSTSLLGASYKAPFGVCPMGMGNMAWPGTDEALMNACAAAGIPYTLSAAGSTSIERLAELAGNHAWFQLYVLSEPAIYQNLIRRAEAAGIKTLVVTIDAAHPSRKLRNLRNGLRQSMLRNPRALLDFALHPRWSIGTLAAGRPRLVNLEHTGVNQQNSLALMASMARARLDWSTLEEIRKLWRGTLLVKGVLAPAQARRMVDAGIDGIIVSNHGGRQQGSVVPTAVALPAIRAAVGPGYPLVLDSGIRSGEDIAKAMILGANFVLVGRPFLYATAALGPHRGAPAVIQLLRDELDTTMAQLGCATIADLTGDRLWRNQ